MSPMAIAAKYSTPKSEAKYPKAFSVPPISSAFEFSAAFENKTAIRHQTTPLATDPTAPALTTRFL